MKRHPFLLKGFLLAFAMLSLASCKKEKITLSVYDLWFSEDASVQEIQVTANCDWTISIDDAADWFSIRRVYEANTSGNGSQVVSVIDTAQVVTGGSGDMTIAVLVEPMEDVLERSSSFTIASAKGTVQARVTVLQNTTQQAELRSITNLVFGVSNVAHWDVDFFGQVIEDSYRAFDFDPYDTTTGFFMYFLENGEGIQRDNVNSQDSAIYYLFTYDYDYEARNLHVEFETVSDTITEIYDAPVLVATEERFHFCHEYRPKQWERCDMKKVGTINPQQKAIMRRKAKKRDGSGPIFKF